MMYILCELGSIIIVRYSVTVNYIKGDKISMEIKTQKC